MMNLIKVIAIVGIVAMLGGIGWTIASGTFGEDAATFGTPLGITSLIDLYLGLLLFWCWIIYRQRQPLAAILWLVGLVFLGNLTAAVYVLWVAHTSAGNWQVFWHGRRPESEA